MQTVADVLQIGLRHQRAGRLTEAEGIYRRILETHPEHSDALHLLGLVAHQTGRDDVALGCVARAIQVNPRAPFYHNNLGNILQDLQRFSDAVMCYQKALELDPEYGEAYNNLGSALQELERPQEALGCYQEALRRNPTHAEAYNNTGSVLLALGYFEDAVASYRQALSLKQNYPDGWTNLGNALITRLRFDEALACYQEALRIQPDHPRAHWNRALVLLLLGDFERGWDEYEWRWKQKRIQAPTSTQPQWDGSPLSGQTILLHAEQGLGDTLQFLRYAPSVKQAGGTVIVQCQERLLPLVEGLPGVDQWVVAGEELPAFDVHAPLLSLPGIFRTELSSIPEPVRLQADPARVEFWRSRLPERAVGISWAGSHTHKRDRDRSMPFACLAPLSQVPGLKLVSLQRGPEMDDLKTAPAGLDIVNPEQEAQSMADTAAIIANLDLVITVDTMLAHLAASLGKPVWNLLSHLPDWRWLLERTDTPWYPGMRLWRQPRPDDWDGVVKELVKALRT